MANAATVQQDWLLVDAENEVLGRLASKIALLVRGKHKTTFTPHVNCGDHVIVLNAGKVQLTGRKWDQKQYIRHTGYPGGQRFAKAKDVRDRFPERLVEYAIRGMLPKNRIGSQLFHNLHVYAGDQHPHEAQQPKEIKL